jgi:hypothetical protein
MQYGMKQHNQNLKFKKIRFLKTRQMKWVWMKEGKYGRGNKLGLCELDSFRSGERLVVGTSEYCHELPSLKQWKEHLEM